jgi:N-acetylmuramoyl-L-alanine amidase
MATSKKYEIERQYIDIGKSRSGKKLEDVRFIVSHETANPTADADDHQKYFGRNVVSASAHVFIDGEKILEIIPLDEKAWHVNYNKPIDNQMFGDDANDVAIGVELCRPGSFNEAYDRYVWYHAYLCHNFGLDPKTKIVQHSRLDPQRRSDPESWLKPNGVTWEQFIKDVVEYYNNWNDNEKVIDREEKVKSETVVGLIRIGDKGSHVKELQQDLLKVGEQLPRYGADGDFGKETLGAVKALQSRHKLAVDGIVGPKTKAKLEAVLKQQSEKKEEPKSIVPYPGHLIKIGSRGKDVERVQRAVGVKTDGIFGPITERAVKDYQRRHGLSVDGIVGPKSWNVMF